MASSSKVSPKEDTLRKLPDELMSKIISHLGIREAVKTCVLCRDWQFLYRTTERMVFDDSFSMPVEGLMLIINGLLSTHIGPLEKFSLSGTVEVPTTVVENWISQLSKFDIKEFELCNYDQEFIGTSALFQCQTLISLDLTSCSIVPSLSFRGFQQLKRLTLILVDVTEDALSQLISKSPVLETVRISECEMIHRLILKSPSLKKLVVEGDFVRLLLEDAPKLACLELFTHDKGVSSLEEMCIQNLLSGMPQLQNLIIQQNYIECMKIDKTLHTGQILNNLKSVSVGLNLTRPKHQSCLLILLRSPNLQELIIQSEGDIQAGCLDINDYNGPFSHLKHVKMQTRSGSTAEIEFIKAMLLNSPALERMAVSFSYLRLSEKRRLEMLTLMKRVKNHLVSFVRASQNAKVVLGYTGQEEVFIF